MISFKEIEYDFDQNSDLVFSRLTWAVTRVDSFNKQLLSNFTKQTSKDWIGTLNERNHEFSLMEPSGSLTLFPLQIILRGKVIETNNRSIINIRFRLGWHTLSFFTLIYLTSAFAIGISIASGESQEILNALIWLFTFPTILTYLLYRRMKKIESKLDFLFSQV